ncbi:hypothetical protein LMH73_019295 [Vibrio splendidus]|nr:hypothetical protein [Vibrio splendidus]MCC4883019.1 hypothetical protein [Vibrio splendidus]
MKIKQLTSIIMSSTAIYCVSVAILFAITYSVVTLLYPSYSGNILYLKSIGAVSIILIMDDVIKFFTRDSSWSKISLMVFGIFFFAISMIPKSLLHEFSHAEVVAISITPLIMLCSLFKYVGFSLDKHKEVGVKSE